MSSHADYDQGIIELVGGPGDEWARLILSGDLDYSRYPQDIMIHFGWDEERQGPVLTREAWVTIDQLFGMLLDDGWEFAVPVGLPDPEAIFEWLADGRVIPIGRQKRADPSATALEPSGHTATGSTTTPTTSRSQPAQPTYQATQTQPPLYGSPTPLSQGTAQPDRARSCSALLIGRYAR